MFSPYMVYWLIVVFLLGLAVGSFLNVVIARLPRDRSLIWPPSTCGSCYQAIAWYDNIPLLSYVVLRGRCRTCAARFSIRYFAVELMTGLCFAGLFYLEVMANVHHWPEPTTRFQSLLTAIPPGHWFGFIFHATLLSLLLAASGCDMQGREIPFSLTLTGTLIGLIGSVLMPWPWPWAVSEDMLPRLFLGQIRPDAALKQGIYAWPVWYPVPDWLAPGTWQMGLATGLAGMLMGTFLLRAIAFIFSKGLGREGLGLGDADLMMMVGSFLGWQLVVVAFFVSVIPGMFLGIYQMLVNKDNSLPFGPSLAVGSIITCLCWDWFGPKLAFVFFWGTAMMVLAGLCAVFLLGMAFFMRLMKGTAE